MKLTNCFWEYSRHKDGPEIEWLSLISGNSAAARIRIQRGTNRHPIKSEFCLTIHTPDISLIDVLNLTDFKRFGIISKVKYPKTVGGQMALIVALNHSSRSGIRVQGATHRGNVFV